MKILCLGRSFSKRLIKILEDYLKKESLQWI